jgi:hypothetical protein
MRKSFVIGVSIIAVVFLSGSTFAQAMSCAEKCTANCGGKGVNCINNCSTRCAQGGIKGVKGGY